MVSGLQYFITNTVTESDLARTKKEKKALDIGCRVALEALGEVKHTLIEDNDQGSDSDGL